MLLLCLAAALAGSTEDHADAPPPLRIATANVWGVPNALHWGFGATGNLRRMSGKKYDNQGRLDGALGEWLTRARSEFDVVSVQELWCDMVRSDGHKMLARNWSLWPLDRVDHCTALRVTPESGLGFLIGALNHWYPAGPAMSLHYQTPAVGGDNLKRKGLAELVLQTRAADRVVEIVVANTHLQSAAKLKRDKRGAEVRQAQVAEALAHFRNEVRPIIWTGDFNFDKSPCRGADLDEETAGLIRAAGFRALEDDVPAIGKRSTSVSGNRYDRVWYRPSREWGIHATTATLHVNGGEPEDPLKIQELSDHMPLEVELQLTPASSEIQFSLSVPVDGTLESAVVREAVGLLGAGGKPTVQHAAYWKHLTEDGFVARIRTSGKEGIEEHKVVNKWLLPEGVHPPETGPSKNGWSSEADIIVTAGGRSVRLMWEDETEELKPSTETTTQVAERMGLAASGLQRGPTEFDIHRWKGTFEGRDKVTVEAIQANGRLVALELSAKGTWPISPGDEAWLSRATTALGARLAASKQGLATLAFEPRVK